MSETKTPRTFPVASAISSQTDATIVDPAIANPGPPAGSFDDIFAMPVPETDADREAARIREEILKSSFGRFDVHDWTEFNAPPCTGNEGDHACEFELRYLKVATAITKNALSPTGPKALKITLYRNKIRFTTSSWAAFADVQYALLRPATTLDNDEQISLILDHALLSKCAVSCPDATVKLLFHSDPSTLSFQAEKVRLDLCTRPKKDFIDHFSELSTPTYVRQINPTILHEAVRYQMLWVEQNDIQQYLSVVTIRDAQAIGGTVASIGLFKSSDFADLNISLRHDHLSVLHDILPKFDQNNAHLFETDNYYILRDENIIFGLEKTSHNCPSVTLPAEHDRVLVERRQLLDGLHRLLVVSIGPEQLVRLQLQGAGRTLLVLSTKDRDERTSRARMECFRTPLTWHQETRSRGRILPI